MKTRPTEKYVREWLAQWDETMVDFERSVFHDWLDQHARIAEQGIQIRELGRGRTSAAETAKALHVEAVQLRARIAELEGLPLRCGETDEDIPLREWHRCSLTDGETWLYQCPVCGEHLAPVGP